jgi:hypothetical protein
LLLRSYRDKESCGVFVKFFVRRFNGTTVSWQSHAYKLLRIVFPFDIKSYNMDLLQDKQLYDNMYVSHANVLIPVKNLVMNWSNDNVQTMSLIQPIGSKVTKMMCLSNAVNMFSYLFYPPYTFWTRRCLTTSDWVRYLRSGVWEFWGSRMHFFQVVRSGCQPFTKCRDAPIIVHNQQYVTPSLRPSNPHFLQPVM